MYAITVSIISLMLSAYTIWRTCRASNPRMNKMGRNPPPPLRFAKPDPTPVPPKSNQTDTPIPSECHIDRHYPCYDVHIGEPDYGTRFQSPPKKP